MTHDLAKELLDLAIERGVMVATAESCTGGMIAAAITDLAGSSAVFDRGFATYSNEAKAEMLGVPIEHTQDPGAVSDLVAREMAEGAVAHSRAQFAVAVTGIAGPGGGSVAKPVGLVYIATASEGGKVEARKFGFAESHGAISRSAIRQATVEEALGMLIAAIEAG